MIRLATEKRFEERLKRWLESEGIYRLGTAQQDMTTSPCGYWEKRHGSMYTGAGLPDMHIVVCGVSIEAELKAPNGKPSELQIQKLNQIDDSGCLGMVLYPKDFERFQALITHIKSGDWISPEIITLSGLERGWKR